MKKLATLALTTIFASAAYAGNDRDPISSDFDSLDNNDDQYISQEEADDDDVWEHFTDIDKNGDKVISLEEFNRYVEQNPTAAGKEQPHKPADKDSMY